MASRSSTLMNFADVFVFWLAGGLDKHVRVLQTAVHGRFPDQFLGRCTLPPSRSPARRAPMTHSPLPHMTACGFNLGQCFTPDSASRRVQPLVQLRAPPPLPAWSNQSGARPGRDGDLTAVRRGGDPRALPSAPLRLLRQSAGSGEARPVPNRPFLCKHLELTGSARQRRRASRPLPARPPPLHGGWRLAIWMGPPASSALNCAILSASAACEEGTGRRGQTQTREIPRPPFPAGADTEMSATV